MTATFITVLKLSRITFLWFTGWILFRLNKYWRLKTLPTD